MPSTDPSSKPSGQKNACFPLSFWMARLNKFKMDSPLRADGLPDLCQQFGIEIQNSF
jgi:hypothetical protein